MNNFVGTGVEEVTGVRHDNNRRVLQLLDVVLEPDQGGQIQMIRGFIEHEDLRL